MSTSCTGGERVVSLTPFLGMQTPDQEPTSAGTDISYQRLKDKPRDFVKQVGAVPRE